MFLVPVLTLSVSSGTLISLIVASYSPATVASSSKCNIPSRRHNTRLHIDHSKDPLPIHRPESLPWSLVSRIPDQSKCRLAKLVISVVLLNRAGPTARSLCVASTELKGRKSQGQSQSRSRSEHTGSSSSIFGVLIIAGFNFLGTSIGAFSISIVSTTVIARRLNWMDCLGWRVP